jgi:penicillin-binding protein 2
LYKCIFAQIPYILLAMQDDSRTIIIRNFILFVAVVYLLRLFYLQVIDDSYIEAAEDNAIQKVVEVPFRGNIYDRNKKLMVSNAPVYDLYVTPNKVRGIDTLRFCNVFQITKADFIKNLANAKAYSPQRPSLFLRQLSVEDFAKVQDELVDFPGFSFQTSAFRKYHSRGIANVIGYVGEISEKQMAEQKNIYYKQGDYIGLSGIEKYYEERLRGKKGVKYILKNSKGAEKGAYKNGELDEPSVPGETMFSSIDIDLQNLTDSLMQNKVGSAIAIEPSTGEILALVSAPSYDPVLLTGRHFSKNYGKLVMDPMRPLLNRPVQARYRPGSTFKTIQSLVALQAGAITPSFGASHAGSPMRCTHNHPVSANVVMGLQQSCNPYFYYVFRRFMMDQNLSEPNVFKRSAKNLTRWHDMVAKFGIGQKLGIDLPNEIKGILPDVAFYDKMYKGANTWKFSNIYSLAIGEGEVTVSPMKMANVACIIANRGYYITPHVIKGIGQIGRIPKDYSERKKVDIDRQYFDYVIEGMYRASQPGGTLSFAAIMPDLPIVGKTGTSQNRVGRDHAIYMCFAPRDNPKIAVAVFVENGGFGGSASGPVASLMIEQYLKGKVSRTAYKDEIIARNYSNNVIAQPLPGATATTTVSNTATTSSTSTTKASTTTQKKTP